MSPDHWVAITYINNCNTCVHWYYTFQVSHKQHTRHYVLYTSNTGPPPLSPRDLPPTHFGAWHKFWMTPRLFHHSILPSCTRQQTVSYRHFITISSDVNKANSHKAKAKAKARVHKAKAKAKASQLCSRPGQGQGQTFAKTRPNQLTCLQSKF